MKVKIYEKESIKNFMNLMCYQNEVIMEKPGVIKFRFSWFGKEFTLEYSCVIPAYCLKCVGERRFVRNVNLERFKQEKYRLNYFLKDMF